MSDPLVSIVLVTCNGGRLLRELVEMVSRQRTDFEVEVIAVDSGSTDGTAEWLAQSPFVRDVIRIAPVPLYNRFQDVHEFFRIFESVLGA